MPQNYLDAGALSSSGDAADFMSQCKLACLKMNSSLWCVPLTLTLTLPLPLTLALTLTLTLTLPLTLTLTLTRSPSCGSSGARRRSS